MGFGLPNIGRAKLAARPGHSVALWYTRATNDPASAQQPALELHINLWKLEKSPNGLDFTALDIGLLIRGASAIENLFLYLPFQVNFASVSDLVHLLAVPEMAIAIFNDNVEVTPSADNQSLFTIKVGKEVLSCWKLNLSKDVNFSSEEVGPGSPPSGGTILKFGRPIFADCVTNIVRYIRFRISLSESGRSTFFTTYDPIDQGILSGFDETDVVDFRFNEKRNLSRSVVEAMSNVLRIDQINHFVIRDMIEDLTLAHQDPRKCRSLEPDVWSKYVAGGGSKNIMLRRAIIFYWRKDRESGDFADYNALARFRRRKTSIWTIAKSSLYIFAFGVLSGWVASELPLVRLQAPAAAKPSVPSQSQAPSEAAPKNPVKNSGSG